MRPPDEETRLSKEETGSRTSATTPTSRRPKRTTPTQQDRVLRMLERGWTCGIVFLQPPDNGPPILRYTGRIFELRQQGVRIDRRACEHPWHNHTAQMWEWKVAPEDTLPGIGDV